MTELILTFLRKGCRAMNFGLNQILNTTLTKLEEYERGGLERVSFIYYDLTSWIKSVEKGTSIVSIRNDK